MRADRPTLFVKLYSIDFGLFGHKECLFKILPKLRFWISELPGRQRISDWRIGTF
jgi:hypothetical protein